MEIKRIGIAGAGTMGYSMADIFASYGFDVTLWNHRKPTLERAKTLISETSRDKIHYTTNLEDIAHLDIVIENVTEDMAIKEGSMNLSARWPMRHDPCDKYIRSFHQCPGPICDAQGTLFRDALVQSADAYSPY